MPYTNTEHPSNTRTTVTIVLSIIFGVSIIPTTALGALYFSLENADVPTLYQEVRVKIRKGTPTNPKDPVFEAKDKVYFIEKTNTCSVTLPTGVVLRSIQLGSGSAYAVVTVVIKKAEFKEVEYKMCYLKKDGVTAEGVYSHVYEASSSKLTSGAETPVSFIVLNSIYTAYTMNPTTVNAGQGPVTLTITVAAERVKGNTGMSQQTAYLIPCPSGGCTSDTLTVEDKDKIAALCSSGTVQGAVTTAVVTGFGTAELRTTFIAPVTPAASYGICVPYCFKAGNCVANDVSWALVNSNTLIKFLPANPSSYTIDTTPGKTLTFTGTGLLAGDKIRTLTATQAHAAGGGKCVFPSTAAQATHYTDEVTTTAGSTTTSTTSTITLTTALPTDGQVCYSRAQTSALWAPVCQKPKVAPTLYFNLENADVPTLYQEVRVNVRKAAAAAAAADPQFAVDDKVYFIETGGTKQCTVTPPVGVTLWSVKEVSQDKTAMVTVIIKNPDFEVKKTYKMCYIKMVKGNICAAVYDASSSKLSAPSTETAVPFTVQSSIYTSYTMDPDIVYAGQGPVTLTITAEEATGKAFGHTQVPKVPYLIPCQNPECSDTDRMASLCSQDNNDGAVKTGEVKGFGTAKLTTTFVAPSAPVTPATPVVSYGICVPYCFKTAGPCAANDVSWSLVNSNTPIKFPTKPTTGPPKPDKEGGGKVKPDASADTVPSTEGNKTTTLSATAISSTIPAVLITSVVFLYLYK